MVVYGPYMIIHGAYKTSYGLMYDVMQIGGSRERSPPGKQGVWKAARTPKKASMIDHITKGRPTSRYPWRALALPSQFVSTKFT